MLDRYDGTRLDSGSRFDLPAWERATFFIGSTLSNYSAPCPHPDCHQPAVRDEVLASDAQERNWRSAFAALRRLLNRRGASIVEGDTGETYFEP